jgi:peptidoglycan/LPS O-acetylase OafA/YrhL
VIQEKLHHRRDIDGLRAIAILAVLGYHAFAGVVPGGFVGVDVFFVISGFLISSIIFVDLDRGRFSFVDFYARRIRRIFPALAVVLTVSLLVGWYALLPDEFAQLGKHVAAGAAFVANIALYGEAGYFDRAAELKPLLHLWSLGVEEQFYLFWPLLLYVAWRLRLRLALVIGTVGAASFFMNVARIKGHEVATFYLPFARLWELLCGALLAYAGTRPHATPAARRSLSPNLLSAVGFAMIAGAVFGLNRAMLYPGWWATLPVIGTCLMLAAGEAGWVNRVVLGSRAMVFIGLISYPLYLWHWPLLAFQRIVNPDGMTTLVRVGLIVAAVLLAWATYRFVEGPIRFHRRRGSAALVMALVMSVVGGLGLAAAREHIRPRSAHFGLEKLLSAAEAKSFPGPNLHPMKAEWDSLMSQGRTTHRVLFMGDSFVEQYYPRIDRLLESDPTGTRGIIFATSGGCPPIPSVVEAHHPGCARLLERALAFAGRADVDVVVIGAHWVGYFLSQERDPRYGYMIRLESGGVARVDQPLGSDAALTNLSDMISALRTAGKKVFLILPSPSETQFDPRRMIVRAWTDMNFRINALGMARSEAMDEMQPIASELRRVAQSTGSIAIDPIATLCGEVCPAMTADGVPIYKDGSHLNPEYVRSHVDFLDDAMRSAPGTN